LGLPTCITLYKTTPETRKNQKHKKHRVGLGVGRNWRGKTIPVLQRDPCWGKNLNLVPKVESNVWGVFKTSRGGSGLELRGTALPSGLGGANKQKTKQGVWRVGQTVQNSLLAK